MSDTRKNAKQWFITWSRLDEQRPIEATHSLEYFMEFMEQEMPNNKVLMAILSHEDHMAVQGDPGDGHGVHIHLVFKLEKKWKCPSDMTFFDHLFGHHPNIQTCRNFEKSVIYTGKHGDYATFNLDYDAMVQAVGSKQSYGFHHAANAIWKEGKTLDQVHDAAPGFFVREKRKLEEYSNYVEKRRKHEQVREPFLGFQDVPTTVEGHEDWQKVVDWTEETFLNGGRLALWIYGTSGVGKTRPWLDENKVPKLRRLYEWCKTGNQQDISLLDAEYVVIDELCGSIPANVLKSIAQMYGMNINFKYNGLKRWPGKVPLVVTSQHSIRDIYKNLDFEDIRALERRFLQVHVTTQYKLKLKRN